MKKRIQILIIVILYALMFVPLSAQTPHTISGIVKDRASVPISGVNIRVEGQKWKASTGVYIGNSSKLHHHLFLCWL